MSAVELAAPATDKPDSSALWRVSFGTVEGELAMVSGEAGKEGGEIGSVVDDLVLPPSSSFVLSWGWGTGNIDWKNSLRTLEH